MLADNWDDLLTVRTEGVWSHSSWSVVGARSLWLSDDSTPTHPCPSPPPPPPTSPSWSAQQGLIYLGRDSSAQEKMKELFPMVSLLRWTHCFTDKETNAAICELALNTNLGLPGCPVVSWGTRDALIFVSSVQHPKLSFTEWNSSD